MQAFKTLLIVAVLSAVAYGVYVALTGASDVGPPPGVTADDWSNAPQVELPTVDPAQSTMPPSHVAAPAAPHVVQPQPAVATEAQQFSTPAAPQDTGTAPPFVSPSVGPSAAGGLPAAAAPPAAVPDPAQSPVQDPAAFAPGQLAPSGDGATAMPTEPAGASPVSAASGTVPDSNFSTDYAIAQGLLQENKLDPALLLLSRWYDDPRLTEQDQQMLLGLLNQLAGTVIYSGEHLLVPPYEVQPGDTLDRIAQHYQVPWQLLAKINGVQDPNQLRPGDRLKMVQGPFDAVVNVRSRTLTLMLAGRFAGRFPIGVGPEQTTPDGEFTVKVKTPNPTYYGPDRVIDGNDPNNPLGKYWIGLDDHLGIHGTNDPQSIGRDDAAGGIRLNPRDIEDVYDMLTVESRVRILR